MANSAVQKRNACWRANWPASGTEISHSRQIHARNAKARASEEEHSGQPSAPEGEKKSIGKRQKAQRFEKEMIMRIAPKRSQDELSEEREPHSR